MRLDPAGVLGAEAMRLLVMLSPIQIAAPLTDEEFAAVGRKFGVAFADDHRAFLAAGLPVGDRWPNWREPDAKQVVDHVAWPVDGVLFDIEHNAFWDGTWVRVPPTFATLCTRRACTSAKQIDVICCGADIADYVIQDFGPTTYDDRAESRRRARPTVGFWSELI